METRASERPAKSSRGADPNRDRRCARPLRQDLDGQRLAARAARVEAGPTGLVLERMEVSHQLKGLEALGKIQRHHDGQTEKARSRFGKDTHTRALRGSVSWSIGERSKTGGQPDRQPSREPDPDPSTRIDSCT
jgi:hypothetical protein